MTASLVQWARRTLRGFTMRDELLELLDAHWVVHIAWPAPSPGLAPHCTPLYYARLRSSKECANAGPALIFFSDPQSEHGRRQRDDVEVGGSIALETEDISRIRGATLKGKVRGESSLRTQELDCARRDYLARHPHAAPFLAKPGPQIYLFEIVWAKLTDNRKGIGAHKELSFASSSASPA